MADCWPWEREMWQKAALLDLNRYAPEFDTSQKRLRPNPPPYVGGTTDGE